MMKSQEIFDNALCLSVSERFQLLEALELSITPTRLEIDREWTAVAKQRLADFDNGKTQAIPNDKVFSEIRNLSMIISNLPEVAEELKANVAGYDLLD